MAAVCHGSTIPANGDGQLFVDKRSGLAEFPGGESERGYGGWHGETWKGRAFSQATR